MGVDYTCGLFYGVSENMLDDAPEDSALFRKAIRVLSGDEYDEEDVDDEGEILPEIESYFSNLEKLFKELNLGYGEYGSMSYGGDGGYYLHIDEIYCSIDVYDYPHVVEFATDSIADRDERIKKVLDFIGIKTELKPALMAFGHVW